MFYVFITQILLAEKRKSLNIWKSFLTVIICFGPMFLGLFSSTCFLLLWWTLLQPAHLPCFPCSWFLSMPYHPLLQDVFSLICVYPEHNWLSRPCSNLKSALPEQLWPNFFWNPKAFPKSHAAGDSSQRALLWYLLRRLSLQLTSTTRYQVTRMWFFFLTLA